MADDKSKVDAADRRTVAGGEPCEVETFAKKHVFTMERARELIAQHGNDRTTLDAAAERLKPPS